MLYGSIVLNPTWQTDCLIYLSLRFQCPFQSCILLLYLSNAGIEREDTWAGTFLEHSLNIPLLNIPLLNICWRFIEHSPSHSLNIQVCLCANIFVGTMTHGSMLEWFVIRRRSYPSLLSMVARPQRRLFHAIPCYKASRVLSDTLLLTGHCTSSYWRTYGPS
jgi:hypothetical protein